MSLPFRQVLRRQASQDRTPADFWTANHGTLILFHPNNDRAASWLDDQHPSELRFGDAAAVSSNYAEIVAAALQDEGFSVE